VTDPLSELMAEVDQELGQQEEAPAEEPAERARDDQGRFTAEPEPEPETEPEPEKILGRFTSADELAKSYEHLEGKLREQGQELGYLRPLAQQMATQHEQPAVPINQETVDWFDEQVEQNPYGAAVWAMQTDASGVLYNRAMESWHEVQPRQASAFERQLEMGAMNQAFSQQMYQATAPLQAQRHQNDFASAWAQVASDLPDLAEHADAILQAAQSAPEVVSLLQSGTLRDKQRVIENLYYLAKGKQATSLGQAAQEMAAKQASDTRVAKATSFVASGSQRAEPEIKSNVQQWFEEVLDPALEQYS
jgi:hypothetical protein